MADFNAASTQSFGQQLGTSGLDFVLGNVQNLINWGLSDSSNRSNMARQYSYWLKQQAVQDRYNRGIMAQQVEHQKDLYDYEYEKEAPLQRVQQLAQSNLNKGLMYGSGMTGMQGSVGSSSSVSSSPSPIRSQQENFLGGLRDIVAMSQAGIHNRLVRSQSDNLDADTRIKDVQVLREEIGVINDQLETERKRIENAIARVEQAKAIKDDRLKAVELDKAERTLEYLVEREKKLNEELDRKIKLLEEQSKTEEKKQTNLTADTALKEEQAITETSKRNALDAQAERDLSQADWNDVRRILDESYGDRERSLSIGRTEAEIDKLRTEPELLRSLTELNDKRNEYTEKDFYLRVGTLILNALHGWRSNNITEQHYKNSDDKSSISAENVISLGRILLPYLLKAV